jgi:hypothetical protein
MFYCGFIEPKIFHSASPMRNTVDPPATIAAAVLTDIFAKWPKTGPLTINERYITQLRGICERIVVNWRRLGLTAHLDRCCPFPPEWKQHFSENLAANFELDWLFAQNTPIKSVKTFIITLMYKLLPD